MLRSTRGLRSSSLLLSSVALALLLQPACGSEDAKKKSVPPQTGGSAGKGGSGGKGGAGGSSGGASGEAGQGGTGAPDSGGMGGENLGGETGTGGASGAGGEGGASGPSCPTGTADCDADPSDCEADVTTLAQCGACGVACQATNGTVICGATGCEMTSCTAGFDDCNATGTDGCETALNTSTDCGACDHSCDGAACTTGLCEAIPIGAPIGGVYRFAMTADAMYRIYGNTPDHGLARTYTLVRTPLAGGSEVIMAEDDMQTVGGLAVDNTYVYWAVNGTSPGVFRKAHTAAANVTPTPLFAPASLPVTLRIRGGNMYWTGLDGIIYTRALSAGAGDPGTPIVTAAEVAGSGTFNMHQDLVTTPTALYWVVLAIPATQAFIRTAPLAGGTAADVSGAITSPWLKLSVAGEDLYWIRANNSAFDGAWHSVNGGAAELLVAQAGLEAVLADGADLYLLSLASSSLFRSPITGGESVKIGPAYAGVYFFDFLGSDAEKVYVTTASSHGAGFFSSGSYPALAFPK